MDKKKIQNIKALVNDIEYINNSCMENENYFDYDTTMELLEIVKEEMLNSMMCSMPKMFLQVIKNKN